MSLLRHCILPVTLGLILAPVAMAGDDKKSSESKEQEQTIRGVVSGVTVMGETDIDYATKKATTAEATYLTIIGHPSDSSEKSGGQGQVASGKEGEKKDTDKDVKRTSNASSDEKASSGEGSRHRMNVYVVAISPKTKVCECKSTGKEGSSSAKEEACDLEKLEIGDRVEVCFNPKMESKSSDDKAGAQASSQKHGRHRTYFGMANSIKIMVEPGSGNSQSSDSSREKDSSK
jgi:hypothetical protein